MKIVKFIFIYLSWFIAILVATCYIFYIKILKIIEYHLNKSELSRIYVWKLFQFQSLICFTFYKTL